MRLRNRITKADFWTDPDLMAWPREKRSFYQSLWALAEDSACIEDSPFGWKCGAWPSPLDADMTVETFTTWRDELIAVAKLVPYFVNHHRYLYVPCMAEHEKPRNPQAPSIPLPEWVQWVSNTSDPRKGTYLHSYNPDGSLVLPLYDTPTSVPALPCPDLTCPDLPGGGVQDTAPAGDIAQVGTAFERYTGKTAGSELTSLCADHSTDVLIEAIRLGAERGKTSPSYLRGIARSLTAEGWTPEPSFTSEPDPFEGL